MTAADVVFSFRRLINLKGNPAFLLGGVTVLARGTHTVARSKAPNTAIPAIVANTSLGIVNSKLARAHGATDRPGADKTDKAEVVQLGASKGAGSGRTFTEYSTTSRIVLDQNPAMGSEAGLRAGRGAQHGRRDAVHQHPARASTRSRSIFPPNRPTR